MQNGTHDEWQPPSAAEENAGQQQQQQQRGNEASDAFEKESLTDGNAFGAEAETRDEEVDEESFPFQWTSRLVMVVILAASGGANFGWDIGVTGGVISMSSFLQKFFPDVYAQQQAASDTSLYCKFDSQILQLFVSSLYLSGLVCSVLSSFVARRLGRTKAMLIGGLMFTLGSALGAGAINTGMLVFSRVVLGVGVGFANQSVPMFLSESSPARIRGAVNSCFQLATTIGIWAAQSVNIGTTTFDEGWRVSLGLGAVPGVVLFIGAMILDDSPNALVERGRYSEAYAVLRRLRGISDVDREFESICCSVDAEHKALLAVEARATSERIETAQYPEVQKSNSVAASVLSVRYSQKLEDKPAPPWYSGWFDKQLGQQWKDLFTQRKFFPGLMFSLHPQTWQQWSGINAIIFFSPQILQAAGLADADLVGTMIIGAVNVSATVVFLFMVDRFGRRKLLLEGAIQMIITQVLYGALLGGGVWTSSLGGAWAGVVVICIFVSGFAWSYGPCGWLLPTELTPLAVRSAALGFSTSVNFLWTFVIGQTFLTMLCAMEWGVFLFFAGLLCISGTLIYFFLPETKGYGIEHIYTRLERHWFWRRYADSSAVRENLRAVRRERTKMTEEIELDQGGAKPGDKLE